MPILSMFFGITIRMQSEKNGKHHTPHLHAIYNEMEVVMSLEGEVIEGCLPRKQQKLLEAWIVLHEEELRTNWACLSEGKAHFKIEPLR